MSTYKTCMESPIGPLLLTSDGCALTEIFMGETERAGGIWDESAAPFPEARRQLTAYFAGERKEFDLPLAPRGTPFQIRVWEELSRIPYGATTSYGELARRIGSPKGSRAVGLANGRNPLPIVVPCHRVIGANGKLVGFGGGLPRKEWLLARERSEAQMEMTLDSSQARSSSTV